MKTNIKPATALPWRYVQTSFPPFADGGTIYEGEEIVQPFENIDGSVARQLVRDHNAYPELVAALKGALGGYDALAKESPERNDDRFIGYVARGDVIRSLLRKLGEAE